MTFPQCNRLFLGLLAIHCGLLAFTSWTFSPVAQEPCQMIAGVTAWRLGRFDLFHVNPPLVRLIAAAPVALLSPTYDAEKYDRPPVGREEYSMARQFLDDNPEHSRRFFFFARLACIPFSLLGACICCKWAGMLYGPTAGLVSAMLWCFSPYVLGNSSTIMTDVPAAAMGTLAMYGFWRWLSTPNWRRAFIAGIYLGLAAVTKFTLLVLYPLLPILWIIDKSFKWMTSEEESCQQTETPGSIVDRCKPSAAGRGSYLSQTMMLGAMWVTSVYLINCVYCFEGSFTRLDEFRFQSTTLTGGGEGNSRPRPKANRFAGTWLGVVPVPLPANFLQGIDTQKLDFEQGLPSYLRGQWADHGWWYYYLYALAIKMPLGTWLLVALATGMTVFSKRNSAAWRDELFLIGGFVAILGLVSSQTGFSVHSRYAIPALPFLFIGTSKIARVLESRPTTGFQTTLATLAAVALCWSTISTMSIYPHSISYFNELAGIVPTSADLPASTNDEGGGQAFSIHTLVRPDLISGPRNGPRHLLDSNIDWSQDLFYLEEWYLSHPEARPFKFAYFGSYPLEQTRIHSDGYPPALDKQCVEENKNVQNGQTQTGPSLPDLPPGSYAVSVNELFGRSSQYRHFLKRRPEALVGYSIYIFKVPPAVPASASHSSEPVMSKANLIAR